MSTPPVRPAERYGDLRPVWHSTLARVLVGTLAVLGVLWVGYASWSSAQQDVRWSDIGYEVIDGGRTEATFDVTIHQGRTATCVVNALAADYSVVGSTRVQVHRPEQAPTTRERVTVLTQQLAVTAVVEACTVP